MAGLLSFLDPTDLKPEARNVGGFLDPTGGDIFNSPEYRRARIFDTLGGIGAALMAAGSRPGADIGSSLAAGLAGGLQAGMGSEDRFLRRAMTKSQIQKNAQDMANERAWAEMFRTPIAASGAAATLPGGQSPAAPSPWSPTPQAKELVDYLAAKPGFNPMLAATAVGNFQQESGLNPMQVHDSGTGFGIGGWRLDRRDALQNYAKLRGGEVADPKLQADFFADELKTRPEWQAFSQAQDPRAAATALMTYFRPAGWTPDNPAAGHGFDNRLNYAQALLSGGGAPTIAQGDASGIPVQLAQYQSQAPQQVFRPQTMQDVIQTIPPGVRQMIGAMGRKEGLPLLMKYADPGSEAVLDTQTNQIVFIPKTMVGRDPRYAPAKVAELDIARQQLANSQRKTDIEERNADVIIGNDGRPIINPTSVEAKRAVSAAQGTDPSSKITLELAQDAIKRSNDWQAAGLKAQSAIGRLGQLQTLLDQVTTDKFKGTTTEIKAIAKGAGIDLEAMGVKDDVGPTQAVIALTNLMALENRDPSSGAGMPGAMSDADRAFLQAASPSITKDPAGNKILIAVKKGDLQRQVDIAKFASEYKRSKAFKEDPAGLDDYVAQKIAGKDYYDRSVLQPQKNATDDYLTNLPPPPAGYSVPGQSAAPPSSVPAPPAGFKVVQ